MNQPTELQTISQLYQATNLEFIARQVVEGFIIGLHKSPFHGFSVEFAEHRLYNPGESVKNIDWKVFARTDKLFTKRFEEETNLRCQVIIDASSSMYYPHETDNNKIRFSVFAAAALIQILKRQRDAAGLSIFSDRLETHTITRSTTVHQKLLFSYLDQIMSSNEKNKQTAAAQCLHEIADNIHKRSLVIIFSDMMDSRETTDDLFAALQHLRYNKHEVVLFHVVDQAHELEFSFDNRPYMFIDLESGEKIKLRASQVKDHYVEQMKKFEKELKLRCGQYRIDFVEADINRGFDQVLMPYLVKRVKMK